MDSAPLKMRFLPFTNKQLAKIATFGAVFVAGNAVLMHYLVSKRFHQSEYFVKAANGVLSNQALVEYIGKPISFGNPNLRDTSSNFSTENEAQFEVPIKGANTKGMMKFSAIRPPVENGNMAQSWKVTSLEVTVDNRPNEKVVLIRNDGG